MNISTWRRVVSWAAASAAAALAGGAAGGCRDFGVGGTGEIRLAEAAIRDIQRRDLSAWAVAGEPPPPEELERTPTTLPTREMSVRPLSLEEARALALENNLDLAVARVEPTVAAERLRAERARFEAVFTTDLRYASIDQATASELVSAQREQWSISPGVRLPLQYGGAVSLALPLDRTRDTNRFSTLNPAYAVNPAVIWEQPLLRGFGVASNAQPIRVAFYAAQQAEARTRLEVIRVLANVDRLYWRLYAAQKEREVREAEFRLAAALLERNRRRLAAQLDPEVEVLRAESALADRLEAVQVAENAVRQRERELKRILNAPDLDLDSPVRLELTTPPGTLFARLDRQRLAAEAVANRMELLEVELRLLSDSATVDAARNGVLPLVALTYQYRVNGLGESFPEAFAQVDDHRFTDHVLGVRMEVPIGNEAARARLRQALAVRMQTLATKSQRTQQIRQEMFDALDQLELSRKNILAAQRRVALARRVLEAEGRLLEAGQRTSTDVLDAQARLAAALSSEVLAVTNHQIAQVDIAFASGTLLGAGNVLWEPVAAAEVGRYVPSAKGAAGVSGPATPARTRAGQARP